MYILKPQISAINTSSDKPMFDCQNSILNLIASLTLGQKYLKTVVNFFANFEYDNYASILLDCVWSYTAHKKKAVTPTFSAERHDLIESFFS